MRVAFVHDWLVSYRGGERVLEALLELYPEAPIYTLFYNPKTMPEAIRRRDVRPVRALKHLNQLRKALLPWLPAIIESLPLEEYDLVISTSSCVAKGIIVGPEARHLCYIHSPMRYVWDQRRHYLGAVFRLPILGALAHWLSQSLRQWDTVSAARVDRFVANSRFVANRVNRYYRRVASVVHPPVAWADFSSALPSTEWADRPYFLAAGALVPYKRFDLAIQACALAGKRLLVAGAGAEEGRLRALALTSGAEVHFIRQPDRQLWASLLAGAEALLFPGIEDFGIIAIEAMATGTPVLAFEGGGARDFILPGQTGAYFSEAKPEALAALLQGFRKAAYDSSQLKLFAKGFEHHAFLEKMRSEIEAVLK